MSAARPEISREQFTTLAAAYAHNWSVNGGLNLSALKFTTDTLYHGPEFKDLRLVEPKDWIDLSYVNATLRAAGVDRGGDQSA